MIAFLLLGGGIVCILIGDICAKFWATTSNPLYLILTILCYFCSTLLYLPAMKIKGLILSTLIWTLGTIIAGTAVGLWFGEVLTAVKLVGVLVGIVSIMLLCL